MGSISGSSLLNQVGFDGGPGSIGVLRIKFSDGAVIDFKDVSYRIYKNLVMAADHSAYYHKHIHSKYSYEKIKP
jgi:hypothetical protein